LPAKRAQPICAEQPLFIRRRLEPENDHVPVRTIRTRAPNLGRIAREGFDPNWRVGIHAIEAGEAGAMDRLKSSDAPNCLTLAQARVESTAYPRKSTPFPQPLSPPDPHCTRHVFIDTRPWPQGL
jgi:hypothetical protein